MYSEHEDDPRVEPPTVGGEAETLVGFLRWQRDTLELKCRGLDAVQMAQRGVPPSAMSLLGLVRHLAEVERNWFRRVLSGEDAPHLYRSPDHPHGDFDGAVADPDVVAEAWSTWRAEVANAERVVAEAASLDVTGQEEWRGAMSLRWVLIHSVEEYARHNGHADLLREVIDGAVGQ